MHQMRISTYQVSSVMLRSKKLEIQKKNVKSVKERILYNVSAFLHFLSLDDKHQIKVGEPFYPVAPNERGRQVWISRDQAFSVGDHDFTEFKRTPFCCNKDSDTWFQWQVILWWPYMRKFEEP
jgi:hypothetical protein